MTMHRRTFMQFTEARGGSYIVPVTVRSGRLPSRAAAMLTEWASLCQAELLENWRRLHSDEPHRYSTATVVYGVGLCAFASSSWSCNSWLQPRYNSLGGIRMFPKNIVRPLKNFVVELTFTGWDFSRRGFEPLDQGAWWRFFAAAKRRLFPASQRWMPRLERLSGQTV